MGPAGICSSLGGYRRSREVGADAKISLATLPNYTTAEKRFGIESHLPVVLIVTGRESLSPFQEVTMRGHRSAWTITLDFPTRTTLQHWLQRRKTPVGLARRARAMLLLKQGHSCVQTSKWVGLADYHVRKWAKRFQERGAAGLHEKLRPGHPQCFRQRWPSISSNWCVKDPTMWVVPSPSGIVPNWLVSSKPMEWSRPFQPTPLSGSCAHINSSRSGIISGFRQMLPVISTLLNRSATWLISTPVHRLL